MNLKSHWDIFNTSLATNTQTLGNFFVTLIQECAVQLFLYKGTRCISSLNIFSRLHREDVDFSYILDNLLDDVHII